jgi:hypothetical protein
MNQVRPSSRLLIMGSLLLPTLASQVLTLSAIEANSFRLMLVPADVKDLVSTLLHQASKFGVLL